MFIILIIIFAFVLLFNVLQNKMVYKLFENGNVIVFGLRGNGKDLTFSHITQLQSSKSIKDKKSKTKRKRCYISNVDYTEGVGYLPFSAESMGLGGNDFHNFINSDVSRYVYPYEDGYDYFISDAGVYFPSQYNGELDKKYKSFPLFQALSRHVGKCNVHCNTQNIGRLWIKIREQSDTYILCRGCNVKKLFGNLYFVTQKLTIYDNLTSAEQKRPPFPIFLMQGKEGRMRKAEYKAKYGNIKKMTLRYVSKITYNDRIFKTILEEGKSE